MKKEKWRFIRLVVLLIAVGLSGNSQAQRAIKSAFKKFEKGEIEAVQDIMASVEVAERDVEYYYLDFLIGIQNADDQGDFTRLKLDVKAMEAPMSEEKLEYMGKQFNFSANSAADARQMLYDRAFDYYSRTATGVASWQEHNAQFRDSPYFERAFENEAAEALKLALASPTLSAFEQLTITYANTKPGQEAAVKLADMVFEEAKANESPEELRSFESRFPWSQHAGEALELARAFEYRDLDKTDLDALKRFLQQHDEGEEIGRCKRRIEEIYLQDLDGAFDMERYRDFKSTISGWRSRTPDVELSADSMLNRHLFLQFLNGQWQEAARTHFNVDRSTSSYGHEMVKRMAENSACIFIPYLDDMFDYSIGRADRSKRLLPEIQSEMILPNGGSFFQVLRPSSVWELCYVDDEGKANPLGGQAFSSVRPSWVNECLVGYSVDGQFIDILGNVVEGYSFQNDEFYRTDSSPFIYLQSDTEEGEKDVCIYDAWSGDKKVISGRVIPQALLGTVSAHELGIVEQPSWELGHWTEHWTGWSDSDGDLNDTFTLVGNSLDSVLKFTGPIRIAKPGSYTSLGQEGGRKIVLDSLGVIVADYEQMEDVIATRNKVERDIYAIDAVGNRMYAQESTAEISDFTKGEPLSLYTLGLIENIYFEEEWSLFGKFSLPDGNSQEEWHGWLRCKGDHYEIKVGFNEHVIVSTHDFSVFETVNLNRTEWTPEAYKARLSEYLMAGETDEYDGEYEDGEEYGEEYYDAEMLGCTGDGESYNWDVYSIFQRLDLHSDWSGSFIPQHVKTALGNSSKQWYHPIHDAFQISKVDESLYTHWTDANGKAFGSFDSKPIYADLERYDEFRCSLFQSFSYGGLDNSFSRKDTELKSMTASWPAFLQPFAAASRKDLFVLCALDQDLSTTTQQLSDAGFGRTEWFEILGELAEICEFSNEYKYAEILNYMVEHGTPADFPLSIYYDAGNANHEQENFRDAISAWDKYIEAKDADPDETLYDGSRLWLYNRMGHCHFELGQYTEARDIWLKALNYAKKKGEESFWENGNIFINIGAAYARLGDRDEMCRYYLIAKGSGAEEAINRARYCE